MSDYPITSERVITDSINNNLLKNQFKNALNDSFIYINSSARVYLAFAKTKYNIIYRRSVYLRSEVTRSNVSVEKIFELIETIDKDVNYHWQKAMLSLLSYNEQCIKDYKTIFKSVKKIEKRIRQHGNLHTADLDMVSDDINKAIKTIPEYVINEPKDLINWRYLAKHFAPVIIDTFDIHTDMYRLLEEELGVRRQKINNNLDIISKFGSTVLDACKYVLNGV